MRSSLRKVAWPVVLSTSIGLAGACAYVTGADDDDKDETATPSHPHAAGPHASPHGDAAKAGGERAHKSTCSGCHDKESVDPAWRERAMSVGHDLSHHVKEGRSCTCCHLGQIEGFGEPLAERCPDCHADMTVTIPAMAQSHCLACHDLTSGADIRETAWECTQCHSNEDADGPQVDVHATQACSACHQPHDEPWVQEERCSNCHGGKEHVLHGNASRQQQLVCADCHQPHEVAGEAADRCVPCHTKDAPTTFASTLFQGHDACTSCHAPHAFSKAEAPSCAGCHADHLPLSGPKEHQNCQSCHDTHDPRSASAAKCVGCHTQIDLSHGGGSAETCTNCHDPHAGATGHAKGAASCSSCHDKVGENGRAHLGHLGCESCHKPHDFDIEGAPLCSKCHQAEAKAAANHTSCASCHGTAHETRPGTTCGTCHKEVQKTVSAGHDMCTQCHDAHPGTLMPKAQTCTNCHQKQAGGPHAGVKGGRSNCHRPHGPSGVATPAACTTCHALSTQQAGGMHAVTGHRDCSSCHKSHEAPKATRATCVGCHEAQQTHEPNARVCNGCHTFTGF
jgi:hypothetical protein